MLALRLDLAPDSSGTGDHLHVGRKRLDDDVALVADGLERFHDLRPRDVVAAGRAAVAAAGVEMPKKLAGLADRGGFGSSPRCSCGTCRGAASPPWNPRLSRASGLGRRCSRKSVSKRLSGSMQISTPSASACFASTFRFFRDERPFDLLLGRLDGVGLADHGVNRADQARGSPSRPPDR